MDAPWTVVPLALFWQGSGSGRSGPHSSYIPDTLLCLLSGIQRPL